jgi:predicted GNAT superfamily acetyltransferase
VNTLELRAVTDPAELVEVDTLYRRTFGIDATDNGLNLRLLIGIASNSGHIVGAWDGAELVGFGLSVAVAADVQARGVGRAIKHAQRTAALADGIDLLRWVYDPMQARNAHFNLDVLGGRVRCLHRDLYGMAAPGRDSGERTDRLVVDWDLIHPTEPVVSQPPADLEPGESRDVAGLFTVAIPADWYDFRRTRGDIEAAALRAATIDAIAAALDRGLVAVSCRRVDDRTAVYLFAAEGTP